MVKHRMAKIPYARLQCQHNLTIKVNDFRPAANQALQAIPEIDWRDPLQTIEMVLPVRDAGTRYLG
jgi:hypothetical protein